MLKLIPLIIIGFLLISGCKPIIELNGNSYRFLSEKSKSKLVEFNHSYCSNCRDTLEYGHFMEMGGDDLNTFIQKNDQVVLKFLNIYCSGAVYSDYVELNKYFDSNDKVKYLLVSKEYDLKTIREFNNSIKTPGVIFIMKDEYYGHKLRKIQNRFRKDLKKSDPQLLITKANTVNDTYIFRSGKLAYTGYEISTGVIDSVLYKL